MIVIGQLISLDLKNSENVKIAIRMLEPFAKLWKLEKLQDKDDESLHPSAWKDIDRALRMASNGKYSELEEMISSWREEIEEDPTPTVRDTDSTTPRKSVHKKIKRKTT